MLMRKIIVILFLCSMSTLIYENTFQQLETNLHGKIGVYAIDTNNNQIIAYRANERFPVQSTSKLIAVGALLKSKISLNEKIYYTKKDLIIWHPITGNYIERGMTLEALAAAAMSYSDNLAVNLIIKKLGGPNVMNTFANNIGNNTFNIKHYEPNLNSNPKNPEDTSTPKDMAISLQKLTLGDTLSQQHRSQLIQWMKDNTTGNKRIRAGVPIGWTVADKTGSGDYGIANDIGILWWPSCKPIVLAIYTIQNKQNVKIRDDIVASVAEFVVNEFLKQDTCFKIN